MGQRYAVPDPQSEKEAHDEIEHQRPGIGDGTTIHHLQVAGDHHQNALAEDGGQTIERGADAHIECLLMGIEPKHVETVGGDVVGST